jgi:energy-coupling factor transport system ATP-binding protein
MAPFFLLFEGRSPRARELVLIATLCAIGIAGRAVFFMLPNCKPVLALTVISGVALGGETGFLVGSVTMLLSNMMFSQGPWTPWQMFAMGLCGFLAGVVFRPGGLARKRIPLCIFGAAAALLVYGGIMNPASAIMYQGGELNRSIIAAYYISGLPFDLVHAAATAVFLFFGAEPMLEKLSRVQIKYGMLE